MKLHKKCEACKGKGYFTVSRTGSYWFDTREVVCQKCFGKGKIVINDGGKKK